MEIDYEWEKEEIIRATKYDFASRFVDEMVNLIDDKIFEYNNNDDFLYEPRFRTTDKLKNLMLGLIEAIESELRKIDETD